MSEPELKINVSGGNISVGNISQGDNAQLNVTQTLHFEQADLQAFYQAITDMAKQKGIIDSDDLRLRNDINQLVKQADQPGVLATIKGLHETYASASKPLMALFAAVVP